MDVERLNVILEASGVSSFTANMAAADRAVAGPKDQLKALAEVSKIATEALKNVKMTAAQAVESRGVAEEIIRGVKGISDASRDAARELDRVHLDQTQALQTKAAAEEQVRSLKEVERQAIATRVATGGGGPGLAGVGRGVLLPAAIGAGALVAPAMGPAALGLGAIATGFAATGVGALGTLMLAFQGVGAAINGDLKAFKDLGAEQQAFVQSIRSLDGWFDKLKETAAEKLFPALNKALHEALSPGTVAAITKAVSEFAGALGKASEQFGRYFGSSQFQQIFGPLMQSGARNLAVMSDAVLHLFDALGQLGRAAIPLTNWFTTVIDKGAKFVDVWVQAKTASGGMASAMGAAKSSLTAVGQLVESLVRVVGALGQALYPVSQVALKDLTDMLNSLASWIKKNQDAIRNLVVGGLDVLKATITAVSNVLQGLIYLFGGTGTGIIAMVVLLTSKVGLLSKAFGTLAGAEAIGGAETAATGLLGTLTRLKALGPIPIAIALSFIPGNSKGQTVLDNAGVGFLGKLPIIGGLSQQEGALLNRIGLGNPSGPTNPAQYSATNMKNELARVSQASAGMSTAQLQQLAAQLAAQFGVPQQQFLRQINQESGFNRNAVSKAGALGIAQFMPGTAAGMGINPLNAGASLFGAAKMMSQLYAKYHDWGLALAAYNAGSGTVDAYLAGRGSLPSETQAYVKDILGHSLGSGGGATGGGGAADASPFGTPPPFTKNLGPKPPKPPVIPAGATHQATIASNYANLAQQLNDTGAQAQKYLDDELAALVKEKQILADKLATASGKAKTELASAVQKVTNEIRDVQTKIKDAIIVSGDALLNSGLRSKLANLSAQFTADSAFAAVLTGDAVDKYRKVLKADLTAQAGVLEQMANQLKAKLPAATGKQKVAIQQEIDKIQGQLSQVNDQILQSLQANVQALQQQVSSAFSAVQQEMDTALGNLYYQNGLKTPSEQLLASMQQQDQLQSLQDAIDQAQQQLQTDTAGALQKHVLDVATGRQWDVFNPAASAQITADQKALDAAKRQLAEYNLSIKAAQERSQADAAYARQVTSLNAQLAKWEQSVLNGTGTMDGLRAIAAQYGIQITAQTIPDFDNLSTAVGDLKQALEDLAAFIEKITGHAPAPIPGGISNGGGGTSGIYAVDTITGHVYTSTPRALPGHPIAMAKGGIVRARPGGTLARIGEAGHDEAVIPLGRNIGGGDVHIHIDGPVVGMTPEEFAKRMTPTIRSELYRTKSRNGRTLNF